MSKSISNPFSSWQAATILVRLERKDLRPHRGQSHSKYEKFHLAGKMLSLSTPWVSFNILILSGPQEQPQPQPQSWIWPVSLIYCDHIVICKTSYLSKMFEICLWSMLRGIRSLEGWPTGPVYILLEPWNSSVPAASLQGKHACSGRKNTWSGLFYNCDNLVICMTANLSFFFYIYQSPKTQVCLFWREARLIWHKGLVRTNALFGTLSWQGTSTTFTFLFLSFF